MQRFDDKCRGRWHHEEGASWCVWVPPASCGILSCMPGIWISFPQRLWLLCVTGLLRCVSVCAAVVLYYQFLHIIHILVENKNQNITCWGLELTKVLLHRLLCVYKTHGICRWTHAARVCGTNKCSLPLWFLLAASGLCKRVLVSGECLVFSTQQRTHIHTWAHMQKFTHKPKHYLTAYTPWFRAHWGKTTMHSSPCSADKRKYPLSFTSGNALTCFQNTHNTREGLNEGFHSI